MICCYQVTKNFCPKYGCASAFSAPSPYYLGLSRRSRNFGPSGSEYNLSTRLSVNSSNHSGMSSDGFPCTVSLSSFLLFFWTSAGSCDGLTRTVLLALSLLVDAGCNVGTTTSCNTDVGDVGVAVLEEPEFSE